MVAGAGLDGERTPSGREWRRQKVLASCLGGQKIGGDGGQKIGGDGDREWRAEKVAARRC